MPSSGGLDNDTMTCSIKGKQVAVYVQALHLFIINPANSRKEICLSKLGPKTGNSPNLSHYLLASVCVKLTGNQVIGETGEIIIGYQEKAVA